MIDCPTCNRDPARMNSRVAECSHVECPFRARAWSDFHNESHAAPVEPPRRNTDPEPLDKVYRK